jgi:hypothetical protein
MSWGLKLVVLLGCLFSLVAVANAQQSLLLNYHNSAGFNFSRTQSFYLTISFYHVQFPGGGSNFYAPIILQRSGNTVASFDWRAKLPANPCTSARFGPFAAGSYQVAGGVWYFFSGGAPYTIRGDGQANTLIVQ